jgi:hypothetical protein
VSFSCTSPHACVFDFCYPAAATPIERSSAPPRDGFSVRSLTRTVRSPASISRNEIAVLAQEPPAVLYRSRGLERLITSQSLFGAIPALVRLESQTPPSSPDLSLLLHLSNLHDEVSRITTCPYKHFFTGSSLHEKTTRFSDNHRGICTRVRLSLDQISA